MTDSLSPCPDRVLAIGSLADGELDAMTALATEEHVRACPGCRAELRRIGQLREMLSDADIGHKAPDTLRQRIAAATGTTTPKPSPRLPHAMPWLGGSAMGALAASLALLLAVPDIREPGLADALVDSQIRSLQSGHLVDVLTSDRHTVKPWFNGRIPYAPPVVDLKDQGFPLVGGRLDVVAREDVAVLVYKRRLHTINVFIRPVPALASPLDSQSHKAGYTLIRWTADGLEYWAVSDVAAHDLDAFRHAFADRAKS